MGEEAFRFLKLSFFIAEWLDATAVLLEKAEFLENNVFFMDRFPGSCEVSDSAPTEGLHLVGDRAFTLVGVFGCIMAKELGASEFGVWGANGEGTPAFSGCFNACEEHDAAADLGVGINRDGGGRIDIGFSEGDFGTIRIGICGTIATLV